MSMYWSGYETLGLVITENEDKEYFMKKYVALNKNEFPDMTEEEAIESLEEALMTQEPLTRSKHAGEDGGETFYITVLSSDHHEGVFMKNANPALAKGYKELSLYGTDIFLVAADKQPSTEQVIRGFFYKSFKEIEYEFREKLEGYLTPDFDYESSIGDVSYALYA